MFGSMTKSLLFCAFFSSFVSDALFSSPIISFIDHNFAPSLESWKEGQIGDILRSFFSQEDSKPSQKKDLEADSKPVSGRRRRKKSQNERGDSGGSIEQTTGEDNAMLTSILSQQQSTLDSELHVLSLKKQQGVRTNLEENDRKETRVSDSKEDEQKEEEEFFPSEGSRRRLIEASGSSCLAAGVDAVSTQTEGSIADSYQDLLSSPTNYRTNMDCHVIVRPALSSSEEQSGKKFQVLLSFSIFDTEGSEQPECTYCMCDSMSIQDDSQISLSFPWSSFVLTNTISVSNDVRFEGRMCGSGNRYEFLSSSQSMRVNFHSDPSLQLKGFFAHYSRVFYSARTIKFVRSRYYVLPSISTDHSLAVDVQVECIECIGGEGVFIQPTVSTLLNVSSRLPLPLSSASSFPSFPVTFSPAVGFSSRIQTLSLPLSTWSPCQAGHASAFCTKNAFGVSPFQRLAWLLFVRLHGASEGVQIGTQTAQFRPVSSSSWLPSTQETQIRNLLLTNEEKGEGTKAREKETIITVVPVVAVLSFLSPPSLIIDEDVKEISVVVICRNCSGVNVSASINSDNAQVLFTKPTQITFFANSAEETSRAQISQIDEKRMVYTFSVTHLDIATFATIFITSTVCPQFSYPNQPCSSSTNSSEGSAVLNKDFAVTQESLSSSSGSSGSNSDSSNNSNNSNNSSSGNSSAVLASFSSIRFTISAASCADVSVRLTAARRKFICVDRRGRNVTTTPQQYIERVRFPFSSTSERNTFLSLLQLPFGRGVCNDGEENEEKHVMTNMLYNYSRYECAQQCISSPCTWYSYCNASCSSSTSSSSLMSSCLLFSQPACYLSTSPLSLPSSAPSSSAPSSSAPSSSAPSSSAPSSSAPSSTNNTSFPSENMSVSPSSSPSVLPTNTPSTLSPTLSLAFKSENFLSFRSPDKEEVCGASLLQFFNLSSFNDLVPSPNTYSNTLSDTTEAERIAGFCGVNSLFAGSVDLLPTKVSATKELVNLNCRALISCTQREVCSASLEAKNVCVCPLDRMGDKCFTNTPFYCTLLRSTAPSSIERAKNPDANTILPSDCDLEVFKKFPDYKMELGGSPPCQSISVEKGAKAVKVPLRLQCSFIESPSEGVKSSSLLQAGWSFPTAPRPLFNYSINTVTNPLPLIESTLSYYSSVRNAQRALNHSSSREENFADYVRYCNVRGKRLPTYRELCPLGIGKPAMIPASSTLFVPILTNTSEEGWVQIGPSPGRMCTEAAAGGVQGLFGCVSMGGFWNEEDENLQIALQLSHLPLPMSSSTASTRLVRDEINRGFARSARDTTQFTITATAINYNRPSASQTLGLQLVKAENLSSSMFTLNISAAQLPSEYSISGRLSVELQLYSVDNRRGATSFVYPSGLAWRAVTTEHFEIVGWNPPSPRESETSNGLTFVLNIVVVVCVVAFCGFARILRECLRDKRKQS